MSRIYASPEKLHFPKDTTLTEILLYHNLNNTPSGTPSIIDGYSGETVFTYASLRTSVRKVARHFFNKLEIRRRTVVGILSTTKTFFPVCVHGILAAGGVVSAFNPMYEPKELAHALKLSKPSHIFVEETLVPKLLKALALCPDLEPEPQLHIWDSEGLTNEKAEPLRIEQIIQHGSSHFEPAKLPPGAAAQELAFICFSSGTSGLVKGVQLTHENVVANLFQQSQGLRGMFDPQTVVTLIVPFFHVLGLAGFCCQFISQGVPIVVFKRFEMAPLLRAIKRHRITHINIVPPIALEFLRNSGATQGDWSSVQCLMNAAAPLKHNQARELCERYGCVVTQWYGMTEASPSVASQREDETHVGGTIGRPLPGMEVRIVDEAGKDAEVGEFILRGPNIMRGYVGDTALSQSPFTSDGFLRTGDIGYADSQGYLYIVDRAKEMIKVKGQQVAPAELEAILMTHPQVQDAAVCGVYDQDGTSEAPVAYITTDIEASRDQQALMANVVDYVNGQVARYKHITGGVHILPAIPRKWVDSRLSEKQIVGLLTDAFRSPSGKILRRLLPANLAAAAARPAHATLNTQNLAKL